MCFEFKKEQTIKAIYKHEEVKKEIQIQKLEKIYRK